MTLSPFPDAEAVVIELVESVSPGSVFTELPESFVAPAIRVQRTGGSDNGVTDYPFVEITSFGASRAKAWEMDALVRQLVLASGGSVHAGVLVDSARTMTPPQQLPDPRFDVRVVTSSYRIGFRRTSQS